VNISNAPLFSKDSSFLSRTGGEFVSPENRWLLLPQSNGILETVAEASKMLRMLCVMNRSPNPVEMKTIDR
jgi:hypothetical protein